MEKSDEHIASFRDLRVWQIGMDLAQQVYELIACFPPQETYSLTSQLRRAAVSIPSNIAEGHTRESSREYLRHLSVAQGSLAELVTQLELAVRLNYLGLPQLGEAMPRAASLAKQLYSLRNAIAQKVRIEEAATRG